MMGKLGPGLSLAKAFQIHPPLFPHPYPSPARKGCGWLGVGGTGRIAPQSKGKVTQTWSLNTQSRGPVSRKGTPSAAGIRSHTLCLRSSGSYRGGQGRPGCQGLPGSSPFAQNCPLPLLCASQRFRLKRLKASPRSKLPEQAIPLSVPQFPRL